MEIPDYLEETTTENNLLKEFKLASHPKGCKLIRLSSKCPRTSPTTGPIIVVSIKGKCDIDRDNKGEETIKNEEGKNRTFFIYLSMKKRKFFEREETELDRWIIE